MTEFFALLSNSGQVEQDSKLWEDLTKSTRLTYLNEHETILVADTHQEYIYFIVQGCIRSFFKRADGAETTCWFFGNGDMVFSESSLLYKQPSQLSMQATCPTKAYRISTQNFELITGAYPEFRNVCLRLQASYHQKNFEHNQLVLRLPLASRFNKFLSQTPRIIGQAKEKDIANFLHMHPNSFSALKRDSMQR
ncbi:Crp/Fnr family transcriptional regulator [Dyadobacter jiangsuensis]|uniref:CRP-like cAMP-binding protein n=1 Tax=Dyadobacter jiangsuensis TaxID=1591085 RepID=A0A2P8F926_9BACT|nr:CRP-like cAMP-binding protein [Dyadobacter jiangsuensis]